MENIAIDDIRKSKDYMASMKESTNFQRRRTVNSKFIAFHLYLTSVKFQ